MRSAMLLSNSFRPDPRVLKEAKGLATRGHQVSIICWDRADELAPYESLCNGVEVIRVQGIRSTYGLGARQVTHLLRFWLAAIPILNVIKPDIVHCHDFDTLPAGLWWGKVHHKPVIYDAHEHYADLVKPRLKGQTGRILYRWITRAELMGSHLSSAIITVDEILADIFLKQNKNVVIIGHYPESSMAQHAAPVLTHPELRLVYVGRLSSDRGILTYTDLVRGLRQLGIPARLTLAGVFTPASEQALLQASLTGIEDAVDLPGWLPYELIPALLQSCDIALCVLSPEERYVKALPVKLFEYMACGLPVIASNFPAIASIVGNVQCGALVEPQLGTINIIRIVEDWWKNRDEARRLGENGRQTVLSQYNWERLVNRLDDLYQSII